MNYLRHRKERIGYLLLMITIVLAWPFLVASNVDAKRFLLYVIAFFAPAIPLFFVRKQIVGLLQRCSKFSAHKLVRIVSISIVVIWVLIRLYFAVIRVINGDFWYLTFIYFSFLPIMGAFLLSISKRAVPVLVIVAMLLSECHIVASGVIFSLCISISVLPRTYPLTLEAILEKEKPSEQQESDCLYIFTQTAKKQDIIPGLEQYIAKRAARSESTYLGYHYLLHMSHNIESEDVFHHRVSTAEEALHLSEIEILFPMPRFRDPNKEE